MNVSLCVVAYNESRVLKKLFQDFINQDYDHSKIEIVLIDSNSTDKTKKIMQDFANEDNGFLRVKVCDNPKKTQACGWNVAIDEFSEEVLIRVDAHASISPDFISENVKVLMSGESVCGGPRPNINERPNDWTDTLLLAESSMFGSSIASYRNGQEKIYVNSVFHGAYKREVIEKVGKFNENLGRTEDNEYHYRVREAGYKICFEPKINSCQHIRGSLEKIMKQKFGNGYWVALTSFVCPKCLSIFHFVPFVFVMGIIFTSILSLFSLNLLSNLMWTAYSILAIVMSVLAVQKQKKTVYQLLLPAIFLALHLSYGVGSLCGFVKHILGKGELNG